MISFIDGDVTKVKIDGPYIIPHIVNHSNSLGAGVALSLAKKWPFVKNLYHSWYNDSIYTDELNDDIEWMLGQVQFVQINDDVYVANMIGQATPGGDIIDGVYLAPIRWDCVREAMLRVRAFAKEHGLKIVAPYFGTELAGGTEEALLQLVNELWSELDVTLVKFIK